MPSDPRRGARRGAEQAAAPRLPFDDEAGAHAIDPIAARDEAARVFAVDPARNVVLEASAGTGKTRVLTTRYVNLLRAGVEPRNILAITFTRKAAAEMRERILGQLKELARQSPADAARWRDLRDRQGDIAISTIDAFCLSLLREFPLEADLDPGFQVVDEAEAPRLVEEALDAALRAARRLASIDPDVTLLHAELGERKLRAALASLLGRRLVAGRLMRRFLGDAGRGRAAGAGNAAAGLNESLDQALERLRTLLSRGEEGIEGFLADGPVHHPAFALLEADVRALASGRIEAPRAVLDRLARHFLTRAGKARARLSFRRQDFASPEAWKRHGQVVASLAPYVADVAHGLEREVNQAMVRGLSRLFRVARWRYLRALGANAAVDFTEGLARALALLRRMDEFSQSRYRLEARYHHVLVDEFQDTSLAQWALVARLVEAWGEGMGLAHDAPLQPSIFVVGDRKQSIYAFRDADVRLLRRARRYVGALRPGGGVRRTISRSFRSDAALLALVNDLCAEMEVAAGRPDAFRYRVSDRFPAAPPRPGDDSERLGLVAETSVTRAAQAVAAEIDRLLGEGQVRDRGTGLPRPARPGDVAVLFRSRESHREYEAALEARGIRSYVYKGLGFFDADEVQDVLALVRFLADPASDLRAAALLRSRFIRLSDAAIARLAPSLAAGLTAPPEAAVEGLDEEDALVLRQARASLAAWLPRVDRVPPAELLDAILAGSAYAFELGGPRQVQARENLKKLRALARRVQNRGYATWARLAGHLDRLSAGDESNAIVDAADAVNLMTVHAAKGLEFAFVFLVNIGRGTGGGGEPVLLLDDPRSRRALVSVQGGLPEAEEAARERDREETKRLLYVALTRARERLYLAAVLRDGRLQPGRGSLAEVLPPGFVELFAGASDAGQAGIGRAEWVSRDGGRHLFRICRPPAPDEDRAAVVKGVTAGPRP